MTHWCRNVERDEAVRAAEDGRDGPLPRLEEAIETITHKGDDMATNGLRTERVTLEVTHKYVFHASAMDWPYMVANYFHRNGESVRVVEEANDALSIAEPFLREIEDIRAASVILNGRVAEITDERETAIRERDELRAECNRLLDARLKVLHVAYETIDKLRARVAELEGQLESVADRAAAAETALEASGWRMLALGEIVTDGDQFLRTDGVWQATSLRNVMAIRDRNRFRRRVSAPAASGNSSAILTSSPAASDAPVAWEHDVPTPHGTGRGVVLIDPVEHPELWEEITGMPVSNARPLVYQAAPAPPEASGVRAEQITQALTADRFAAAVQEADTLRTRVAELEGERDTAIRERDELRRCPECNGHGQEDCGSMDQADQWVNSDGPPCRGCGASGTIEGFIKVAATLHARIDKLGVELLGLRGDVKAAETDNDRLRGQLESVADRAAAETALESAPAASDGGLTPNAWGVVDELKDAAVRLPHCGGERLQRAIAAAGRLLTQPGPSVPASGAAGTEVSAWGVMVHRDAAVLCIPFAVREAADHWVRLNAENEKMTVVPLYAAPQAASGWLTAEERDFLGQVRDYHATAAMGTGSAAHESHSRRVYGLLGDLLARSTPPEVV